MTKDATLAAQFKAAMLEFNKAPTNDAFTAALRTSPAFAGLCTIAGLVSFNYAVPLANAGANIGALRACVGSAPFCPFGVCVFHFTSLHFTYPTLNTTRAVGDTTGNAITPAVAVLDEAGMVRRRNAATALFSLSPVPY